MVKVCKIWCNDVYMYILYCDIFCWKLIDRIFFNRILIPGRYLGASPLFPIATVLQVIISKQDIHIHVCKIFRNYSTITGINNTLKIAIFRMCYGENSTVKFLKTLADNAFRHNYSMMQI